MLQPRLCSVVIIRDSPLFQPRAFSRSRYRYLLTQAFQASVLDVCLFYSRPFQYKCGRPMLNLEGYSQLHGKLRGRESELLLQ